MSISVSIQSTQKAFNSFLWNTEFTTAHTLVIISSSLILTLKVNLGISSSSTQLRSLFKDRRVTRSPEQSLELAHKEITDHSVHILTTHAFPRLNLHPFPHLGSLPSLRSNLPAFAQNATENVPEEARIINPTSR